MVWSITRRRAGFVQRLTCDNVLSHVAGEGKAGAGREGAEPVRRRWGTTEAPCKVIDQRPINLILADGLEVVRQGSEWTGANHAGGLCP